MHAEVAKLLLHNFVFECAKGPDLEALALARDDGLQVNSEAALLHENQVQVHVVGEGQSLTVLKFDIFNVHHKLQIEINTSLTRFSQS